MRFSLGHPVEIKGLKGLRWPVMHTFIEELCESSEQAKRRCDELNMKDMPRPERKRTLSESKVQE